MGGFLSFTQKRDYVRQPEETAGFSVVCSGPLGHNRLNKDLFDVQNKE